MKKLNRLIFLLIFIYSGQALCNIAKPLSDKSDNFDGDGPLLGYTINNASALPDVSRENGRYKAYLFNNSGNRTLHYKKYQGRLDAKLLSFPFEFIARNIGIGTPSDTQTPPAAVRGFNFAGVQVHVLELESRNSSHIVIGHRGKTAFTIEGKNTVNGKSSVDDMGKNILPTGRADIRVVGNADRSLTIYWQQPEQKVDNWKLYNGYKKGNGKLPGNAPKYGPQVYVGLITYAQGKKGLPFVGTCDAIEIYE